MCRVERLMNRLFSCFQGGPKLNGSAPPAPGPPPPPPPPQAPPTPVALPPDAPPIPEAPPTDAGDARSSLLGSIQGFNKQGLKKAVTVDKAAPKI
jgi:hypothetical protein